MKRIRNIILLILTLPLFPVLWIVGQVLILLHKRPLRRFYEERSRDQDYIPLSYIPDLFVHFLLEIEDDEFYEHHGFSTSGIKDAIVLNHKSGFILTGGSTLTQQLVKNIYFSFEKSYLRKAMELLITIYAEHILTKDQILELYINIVYFGSGIYGLTHAARFYFDKKVEDLTVNQMFLLATLLYAPTKSNPLWYPDVLERIRDKRLNLLIKRGTISEEHANLISSYHADCLDPELQTREKIRDTYPRDICLVNDRFGLNRRKERVTIP